MELALWWEKLDAVAAVQALPLGRLQKAGKQMAKDVAWAARTWQGWEEVGKYKSHYYVDWLLQSTIVILLVIRNYVQTCFTVFALMIKWGTISYAWLSWL